ncbi:zonular occludens toxin domain-containing protein [Neisseria elongata]|uniref:zonular occludens toxin domain-containing protein n=1 Tax=Neisseria elongata TaxID=495 RepID=UPI001EFA25B5|nr:zonular occludens toxin domain-containing protein [Neisseria elongata]
MKEQPFQDFLPYYGSLVVIDEAQRPFPIRSAAAKVPPYIEAFATHRPLGLDIVFITQHPSFLDSFVRRLVQRHIHISIKPVGRKFYEWNECVGQKDSS